MRGKIHFRSGRVLSYIVSWSGGKDSCFACYLASKDGYKVSHLVNFISRETRRVSFHGTEAKLISLQSQAIGVPLLQKETTWEGYEREFKEAVESLKSSGIKGMIFGDIYIPEHREWVERVCDDLSIEALEPLWGRNPEEILQGFMTAGFEAIVISANSRFIDRDWVGHPVDMDFMTYLKNKNIDICGENGEYHTLVLSGPIFRRRIEIIQSRVIARDGYWFLDTVKYRLV